MFRKSFMIYLADNQFHSADPILISPDSTIGYHQIQSQIRILTRHKVQGYAVSRASGFPLGMLFNNISAKRRPLSAVISRQLSRASFYGNKKKRGKKEEKKERPSLSGGSHEKRMQRRLYRLYHLADVGETGGREFKPRG